MNDSSAINPDFLKGIMGLKGADPVGALRPFMQIGNAQIIEPLLKDVDMYRFGPDLLQIACQEGKKDIVEMLIAKKADVLQPPELVSGDDQYRKAPFTISAVKSGSLETLECILKNGGSLGDAGAICLSKKKKNVVASNLIGCAAYHGRRDMLDHLIKRLGITCIEVPAMENVDVHAKKVTTTLQKEFADYTPLMLAVASADKCLECLKMLLKKGANTKVKDAFGNTLLHIAALNGNNKILEYLARNLTINIFERNQKGETALNICQSLKNQSGVDIMTQFQQDCDQTKSTADQLLAELEAKEEHDEEAKAKRRQKKWRNKINKIAKAENIDPEEVEKRLMAEEEARKEQERLDAIKKEEDEKQEALKEKQRKEELKRKRAEMIRQQELEELEEQRRYEQAEREEREARRKAQEEKRERFRSAAREARDAQKQTRQPRHQQQEAEEKPKTERVKSARRPAAPQQQETRQPRHQAQPKEEVRAKSKSVRRGGEEIEVENKIHGTDDKAKGPIFGLSGEMAVGAATSKKAQQRLKKQLKKQQEEEEEQKAMMERVAKEKAEAQAQKEIEERKKLAEERKAERLKKKQEKEEAEKALKLQKEKEEAEDKEAKEAKEAEKKKKKEKKEKKPEGGKKEMVYRAKVKEDEPQEPKETPSKEEPKKPAESKKPVEPKKAVEPKKTAAEPKKAAEPTKPVEPKKEATTTEQPKKTPEPETTETKKETETTSSIAPKKSEKSKATKKTKGEFGKENSSSAMNSSVKTSGDGLRLEIEQLQKLVLQKEREMGKLQLLVDNQNRKMEALETENVELKEQLVSSASGDTLKQSVGQLSLQLKQQVKANKMQATRILELEEQLWQSKQ